MNVTVGFALDAGHIRQARLVLEGIAPVPWRNPAVEAVLEDLPLSPALVACAASAAWSELSPCLTIPSRWRFNATWWSPPLWQSLCCFGRKLIW
ncbi:MAG: hypothetical protein ACRERE_01545 [Candidatus Entotheonellia bacterium]